MDAYIGSIIQWGANFAPRGWLFCEGQLLPISQYTAVFSLLGTIYGGDGRTTFALPDLRGRIPVGAGHGPGLTDRRIGTKGGTYQTSLNATNLPPFKMQIDATVQVAVPSVDAPANSTAPTGVAAESTFQGDAVQSYSDAAANTQLAAGNVSLTGTTNPVGGSVPFNNLQPSLGLRHIMCIYGIFPSRS